MSEPQEHPQTQPPPLPAAPPIETSEHAEVLAELEKLQANKPGWGGAIWVLVGSVVLFFAAGAKQWDWKFTLWIIPVIFLHECGHWIAMRVFKYRNLRMFFIPFFGAAVTGRNWNVAGWKKVIVALAGPLPGIALGCALGLVAMFLHISWLTKAALLLILLNGFNLLPFLPLDGGHVLQAVLFCRNRWLDGAFRLVAVLGLAAMWLFGMGRLLLILAIPMALHLPVAFKLAKVADKLRALMLPPPLPGEDRIPTATAQSIISELKSELPKGAGNKLLAAHALNVFETLNARPPGALASIALLVLHGGSFLVSAIFALLLTVSMHGGLGDFFKAAVRQPERVFACGEVQSWEGGQARDGQPSPRNLVIASFSNYRRAADVFGDLTNRLPDTARVTLFGESVLLALPAGDDAARERWFEEIQTLSTNIFVAVSNRPVTVRLYCVAPTPAVTTNIVQAVNDYFQTTPGLHLIPPWSPEAQQPGFATHAQARREWQRIDAELSRIWRDPAMMELNKRINAATKRGATAESTQLLAEQQSLSVQLETRAREELRTRGTNRIEGALLDLHRELNGLDYTNQVERTEVRRRIAARLGEVAYVDGKPAVQAVALGATMGVASSHGLLIEMSWLNLNDPSLGLPALTRWLCDQRCASFKYDFGMDFGFNEELFEGMEPE